MDDAIWSKMWPAIEFATNLNPSDTDLKSPDKNSIKFNAMLIIKFELIAISIDLLDFMRETKINVSTILIIKNALKINPIKKVVSEQIENDNDENEKIKLRIQINTQVEIVNLKWKIKHKNKNKT